MRTKCYHCNDPHLAPSVCKRAHCAIVHTGGALAHIQRVVKEGLIFQAELLWPVPHRRELQNFVLSQGYTLTQGKVLIHEGEKCRQEAQWRTVTQKLHSKLSAVLMKRETKGTEKCSLIKLPRKVTASCQIILPCCARPFVVGSWKGKCWTQGSTCCRSAQSGTSLWTQRLLGTAPLTAIRSSGTAKTKETVQETRKGSDYTKHVGFQF